MSPCALSPEQIEATTAFHGHWCPGLAIGIRAAEWALRDLGPHAADEELVAVVETDMCGVDAIQFLTGCTLGKGNLIHLDHGKMAFSFHRRSDGRALRLVLKPRAPDRRAAELKEKKKQGSLSEAELAEMKDLRAAHAQRIMDGALEDLFSVEALSTPPPAKARLMASLACADCGEETMESRTRRFGGQVLCIPCFEKRERRL